MEGTDKAIIKAAFKKERDSNWIKEALAFHTLLYSYKRPVDFAKFIENVGSLHPDTVVKGVEIVGIRPYYMSFKVDFERNSSIQTYDFEIDIKEDKLVLWTYKDNSVKSIRAIINL